MKSVMIIFDQAHYESVLNVLSVLNIRGFTAWKNVLGKGSHTGMPHYGSHAWPPTNNAILTVIGDEKVGKLLEALKRVDEATENLGLRAFVSPVEQMI